ncbi:hypothetical protein DFJ74DRAFT_310727 [Hyaloraphidium curvatum]|nr:hypothetical protein DFJ74DRAFT_310727 [Hyaloraphidium curvatum]
MKISHLFPLLLPLSFLLCTSVPSNAQQRGLSTKHSRRRPCCESLPMHTESRPPPTMPLKLSRHVLGEEALEFPNILVQVLQCDLLVARSQTTTAEAREEKYLDATDISFDAGNVPVYLRFHRLHIRLQRALDRTSVRSTTKKRERRRWYLNAEAKGQKKAERRGEERVRSRISLQVLYRALGHEAVG